jgi:CheY-like chemotaxis protein
MVVVGKLNAVLWVDDNKDALKVVGGRLKRMGHVVMTARNRDEALAFVSDGQASIDIAVVDYCLPNDGGLEIIEALRVHRPELPAVIWSGLALKEAHDRAKAAGVRWFDKLTPSDLFAAIKNGTAPTTLDSREDHRRHYYMELFHRHGNNVSKAERATGFSRSTFQRNMHPEWIIQDLEAEKRSRNRADRVDVDVENSSERG